MRKTQAAGAAVAALVASLAATAVPSAEAATRTKPAPVTGLRACGTLSKPGNYRLTTTVRSAAGSCFVLNAPGIFLDLAGHVIDGPGRGIGVQIDATANHDEVVSTAQGAAIGGFGTGIADAGDHAVITGPNLNIADNSNTGVWVDAHRGASLTYLRLNGNRYYGAHLQQDSGTTLLGNQINGSMVGIWAQSSTGVRLTDNQIMGSHLAGMDLGCAGSGALTGGTCADPGGNAQVRYNVLIDNGNYGLLVAAGNLGDFLVGNRVIDDRLTDLYDGNSDCRGKSGGNTWTRDTGSANRHVSASCIG